MTAPRRILGLASLSGTIWVGAGSVLLGASGYAFLTLTAKLVPEADYAALASLYLLVALVGPALFIPVEQEATRLVSRWGALHDGTRAVLRQLALTSTGLTFSAVVVLLALSPLLVGRVFDGSWGLLLALILSVVGYGGACLIRGAFAGSHRLREYAIVVGVDGLMRLIPCVVLALLGVSSPLPYGLALGLGSVAALLVGLLWFRAGADGPGLPWRTLLAAIGWLVAAWGASFTLANIAPVIVKALLLSDPVRAGVFAFCFVVARVPVFVLLSLQAILLPALSRAAATRDLTGLRHGIKRGLLIVGVLGLGALVLTVPLCGWLTGLLFPTAPALSAWTLTLLAIGTILAMLVQVLQPALIAVAGHRVVAVAWAAGVACFAAAFALPVDPVAAATAAQVVAGVATCAVMGFSLLRVLRAAPAVPAQVVA